MNVPTRLLLLRHGEVAERYQHTFAGRIDMELSAKGEQQASALADYLTQRSVDAVYASPMKRVQQTLGPFLQRRPMTPVVLADLQEADFGDWAGLNREQVQARFNANASDWLAWLQNSAIPNGESYASFRGRIERSLKAILGNPAGQTLAVFCHGGVIRMMLAVLLNQPLPTMALFELDYASVSQVALSPGKTRLQLLNFKPWQHPA